MLDKVQQGVNSLNQVFNSNDEIMRRLIAVEDQLNFITNVASLTYIQGRLRIDRAVPANSADVAVTDQLYDRVVTTAFEYILVNNSGTLEWVQITVSTF